MKEKALVAIGLAFVIIAIISSFLIIYKSYEFNREFKIDIPIQQGKVAQGTVSFCIDIELPNLTYIGNLNATENSAFSYTVTATSPSNSTVYFYDDTSMFEINNLTGVISFTPASIHVGTHTVKISARHNVCEGSEDSETITFTVFEAPAGPGPEPPPPGGGGGGGAPTPPGEVENKTCGGENWSCGDWGKCNLASEHENVTYMLEFCLERNIIAEKCGFTIRNCTDLNHCNTTVNKPETLDACVYTPLPITIIPPAEVPWRKPISCGDKFCEVSEIFICFNDCWPFWMIVMMIAGVLFITVRNRRKSRKEEILKALRKIRMEEKVKTDLDALEALLDKFKNLSLSDIAYAFEVDKAKAERMCGLMEKKGKADISYPPFGEIKLKLKNK